MAGLAVAAGRLEHYITFHPADVAFLAGVFGSRALVCVHVVEVGMVRTESGPWALHRVVMLLRSPKKHMQARLEVPSVPNEEKD